jgi:hypothetical protein
VAQSLSHLQLEPDAEDPQVEREAVSRFFDKYVMYPGKDSRKGFLEFLPYLFEEVNVDGRCALRWAVQAAALADVSREGQQGMALSKTALELYGKALSALSSSLSEKGKIPDDYDLMAVVMLDLFEVWCLMRFDTSYLGHFHVLMDTNRPSTCQTPLVAHMHKE